MALDKGKSERLVDTNFTDWTPDKVAAYLKTKECGQYAELFLKHNVDGSVVHTLKDTDLKEMGIATLGDRYKVVAAINGLKEARAQKDREKILCEGTEALYFGWCDQCQKTTCFSTIMDTEKYILRYNFLEIRRPEAKRVGRWRLCFGNSYKTITVDLSNISNVELDMIPPPCFDKFICGAKGFDKVIVNLSTPQNGFEVLQLQRGEGEFMKRKLMNQVEIMQVMERS